MVASHVETLHVGEVWWKATKLSNTDSTNHPRRDGSSLPPPTMNTKILITLDYITLAVSRTFVGDVVVSLSHRSKPIILKQRLALQYQLSFA